MAIEISGITTQVMDLKTDKPGVTRKEEITTGFKNVNDYVRHLQGKYRYMNAGVVSMKGIPTTVSVSPAFLEKCNKDPEKAAFLEENLSALPDCNARSILACPGTLKSIDYVFDENGHITAYSCGTSDPDGKVEKENAERRAKEEKEEKKLAEKKRAEKKAEEKRAENRRIKKENIIKESPEEISITVIGTDIKEMTLQLTERMTLSSGSAAGATSFDLKA